MFAQIQTQTAHSYSAAQLQSAAYRRPQKSVDVHTHVQTQACLKRHTLSPSKEMFKKLNWLPFNELVKYKQACLIYKSTTDQTPSYIQDLLTNVADCVSHSLRSSAQYKLYLPRAHSKSLSYLGVNIFNSIPKDIRHAESLSQFKVGYHKLLLEHIQNR